MAGWRWGTAATALLALGCVLVWHAEADGSDTPVFGYKVVHAYPHDPEAFTQGLEFRDGFLYEGTGLNGRSSVRKVELETGKVLERVPVPQQYFGEGITVFGRMLVELTWQSHEGFVYDVRSFERLRSFSYSGEGWGLANDGRQIYMSDGTPEIRVWNGGDLSEMRRIRVHDGEKAIDNLNELEIVKGAIYANVWMTDRVAMISPLDGRVAGWIDLTGLLPEPERELADVLNGIAYDAQRDRLFFTGKLWPKLFELKIVPRSKAHD